MPYVEANGQRIHYRDSGGDGPAVVLSHGYLMDHEMWAPQVDELAGTYRCITWDERCWGQTEASEEPFDYWDLADDCLALLEALGVDRAVLVGMSQGGFLTMRAALRAPERVRGLVLVDTDPYCFDAATKDMYHALQDQALADGMGDDLAAAVSAMLFAPGYDAARWWAKWRARPPRTMQPAFDCLLGRDDVSDRLASIACPTLVVHGELDAAFPIDGVERWARTMPGLVDVVRVPDAGHSSNLERPDVVTPRLAAFLADLG